MRRTALISLIILTGITSLWLLLAWMGKTESTYRQPRPGMRYEKNATLTDQPLEPIIYEPHHFADGEACFYKVRVVKGILTLPAGKVTFRANMIDKNGTTLWKFTLKGGAIGGLVKYDATSVVNTSFTHSLEYHTIQTDLSSRKVDLVFDEKNRQCKRNLDGKPDGQVETEASTFDPLSIIFKFRELDLEAAGEFSSAVCDGKATFPSKIMVVGKQEIMIGEKTFQAILVEPDLGQLRGVFKKDPDAKLQ
ncbi:MAG: DUF3108 domain-containing protein, partial [Verrucomicrobiota bacterium]|nr:DUF3108 domain-containing protein [Verrucomicrobiota bacterium]